MRDGDVDVVEGVLHDPRGHVGLLSVLVQALENVREDALDESIY